MLQFIPALIASLIEKPRPSRFTTPAEFAAYLREHGEQISDGMTREEERVALEAAKLGLARWQRGGWADPDYYSPIIGGER